MLMDWIPDGKNKLLGQLRKVALTELIHNRRMELWLRASNDSGKPLPTANGLDLSECSVRLVLEYEPPEVDAAVGKVLLDPKQASPSPKSILPNDSAASFIAAAHHELVPAPGQGDAGVGMMLKLGDKGMFVVDLLVEVCKNPFLPLQTLFAKCLFSTAAPLLEYSLDTRLRPTRDRAHQLLYRARLPQEMS